MCSVCVCVCVCVMCARERPKGQSGLFGSGIDQCQSSGLISDPSKNRKQQAALPPSSRYFETFPRGRGPKLKVLSRPEGALTPCRVGYDGGRMISSRINKTDYTMASTE